MAGLVPAIHENADGDPRDRSGGDDVRGAGGSIAADAIPLRLRRHGGTPRQVLAMTLLGTLVLALFASHDLASWLDHMGGGPVLDPLQRAAAAWDGAMDRLGLTRPQAALRNAMHRLLDLGW